MRTQSAMIHFRISTRYSDNALRSNTKIFGQKNARNSKQCRIYAQGRRIASEVRILNSERTAKALCLAKLEIEFSKIRLHSLSVLFGHF